MAIDSSAASMHTYALILGLRSELEYDGKRR